MNTTDWLNNNCSKRHTPPPPAESHWDFHITDGHFTTGETLLRIYQTSSNTFPAALFTDEGFGIPIENRPANLHEIQQLTTTLGCNTRCTRCNQLHAENHCTQPPNKPR